MTPRPGPIVMSRWRAAVVVLALLAIGAYLGLSIGQALVPGPAATATPTTAVARTSAASGPAGRSGPAAPHGSPRTSTTPAAGLPAFQDLPVIPGFGPTGRTQAARVVRITDGDTVRVLLDGVDRPLRYIGMDTPESVKPDSPVEPFARASTEANRALVEGRSVTLEYDVSETDRFDRLLRSVWLERPDGWLLVNLELVRLGFAQAATFPPDVRYVELYLAAQRVARDAARGQWSVTP